MRSWRNTPAMSAGEGRERRADLLGSRQRGAGSGGQQRGGQFDQGRDTAAGRVGQVDSRVEALGEPADHVMPEEPGRGHVEALLAA